VVEYAKTEDLLYSHLRQSEMDIAQPEEERGVFLSLTTHSQKDVVRDYCLPISQSFYCWPMLEARAWTITRGTTAVKAGKITQISNAVSSALK
jgi:hypothetical protein